MILRTPRLRIRHFTLADAEFVLRLLNDADFLRYIGDRGVRNMIDAENYLRDGPIASYAKNGHGLNAVVQESTGVCVGMCGVLKRDTLPEPDLGYAFLPESRGAGFAFEAAQAVLQHAIGELKIPALLAIVQSDNLGSIGLLKKLGFDGVESPDALLRFRFRQ